MDEQLRPDTLRGDCATIDVTATITTHGETPTVKNNIYEIKKAARNEGAVRIAKFIMEAAENPDTTEILAFIKTADGYHSVSTELGGMAELLAVLEMAKYDCLRKMTS